MSQAEAQGRLTLDQIADTKKEEKALVYPRRIVFAAAALVLLSGLANVVRAAMTLYYSTRLPALPVSAPWSYLLAVAAIWAGVLIFAGASLMRRISWSRKAVLVTLTIYQAHLWLNRLLFDSSDYALGTRARDLFLSLLVLGLVWGGLSLPSVKELFRR